MRTARETYLGLFRERYGVPLPQAARDRLPDHLNRPDERTQPTTPPGHQPRARVTHQGDTRTQHHPTAPQ